MSYTNFKFPLNVTSSDKWHQILSYSYDPSTTYGSSPIHFTFMSTLLAVSVSGDNLKNWFKAGFINIGFYNFVDPGSEDAPMALVSSEMLPLNQLRLIQMPEFIGLTDIEFQGEIRLVSYMPECQIEVWQFFS